MKLRSTTAFVLFYCLLVTLHGDVTVAEEDTVIATGVVFDDLNRNGQRDPNELGVADVSVSNGLDVARTDSTGRYRIAMEPRQILFVSQPRGYVVPVDDNNMPQFYYLHYPEGSTKQFDGETIRWRFPVIETTGPLPNQINFPLHRLEQIRTKFRAHAFADPQAGTDLEQDRLREDLINTLIGNPWGAEFLITVGDVVNDNLKLYDRHKVMIGQIGAPQWTLPGNHDINYRSPDAVHANETYKKHFGPPYYSFNFGNVHVVALNNVEYAGKGNKTPNGKAYRGYISDEQIRWLEQDLKFVNPDQLILIATHIPLVAEASDGKQSISGPGTYNFGQLLALLKPFSQIYGIAGHDTGNSWKVQVNHRHGWHQQPWIAHTLAEVRGSGWSRGRRDSRGVAEAIMADGNPNGFYLLKFDDTQLVPEFIPFPFGPDATRRLRVVLDPPLILPGQTSIHRGQLQPETKVVVNLFDGGVRDKVEMSLDGGPWSGMAYVIRTDPFVEASTADARKAGVPFTKAESSAHLWELPLPDEISSGLHVVTIKTIDEFQQERHGVLTFEVTARE